MTVVLPLNPLSWTDPWLKFNPHLGQEPPTLQPPSPSSSNCLPPPSPSSPLSSPRHDPPSSSALTFDNLQKLNSRAYPSSTDKTLIDSRADEQSPSQLSVTTMSDPSTPLQVINVLRRNRIFLNDPEAEDIGRDLIKKAKDVLKDTRGSDWSPEKAIEAKEIIRDHCTENESTFMLNLMGAMKGQDRLVPRCELTQEEKDEAKNWIRRAFRHDHLRMRFDRDFTQGSVPEISSHQNAQWDAILAKCPRVKNPKPDVAFSVYRDAFSQHLQDIFAYLDCALNGPDAFHIFCLMECKCMNASIQEAENQCLGAGAATVQNRRNYNRRISVQWKPSQDKESQQPFDGLARQDAYLRAEGAQDPHLSPQPLELTGRRPQARQQSSSLPPQQLRVEPSLSAASPSLNFTGVPIDKVVSALEKGKPDMDSWVFSFAIAPDQAKCYVNWCLVYPSGILHWHMHLLDVYSFHKVDDISRMHHDLDNILDWGVGPWKCKIEAQAELKIQSGELLDEAPPAKKRKINQG